MQYYTILYNLSVAYVPFLQETVLFLQNLFTLYIQGLRALMLALVSVNILYRIECLLLEPGSVYEKLFHNIHTSISTRISYYSYKIFSHYTYKGSEP